MIRSSTSRLREKASKQYICCQCRSKAQQWIPRIAARSASNANRARSENTKGRMGQRHYNATRPAQATLEVNSIDSPPPPPIESLTRKRLRQWELENVQNLVEDIVIKMDKPDAKAVSNSNIRPQSTNFYLEVDREEGEEEGEERLNNLRSEHGLVDVGLRRGFLLPGDMVELISHGVRREVAIFVQEFTKQSQFYTMSGRWVHRSASKVKFFVPNFVDPEELEEIKAWLPTSDITEEMADQLQSFDIKEVPRNLGKPLIEKLRKFWADADATYLAAAVKMDNAHSLVADNARFTYASLPQIAESVLGDTVPTMDDGKFAPHVLYALHRTIMQDDVGFQPQAKQVMRGESEYEINPRNEAISINKIADALRMSRTSRIAQRRGIKDDMTTSSRQSFDRFVQKARKAIDASRKIRDFTAHGVLGPSNKRAPEDSQLRIDELSVEYDDTDTDWIQFLESWACLKSFSPDSALSGIGSGILRAIGRYNNVPLNQATAFTCLVELGIVSPWENVAAFALRLHYTSNRLSSGKTSLLTKDTSPDKMASMRKDWGDLRVYCIDDTSASEIDDGISVESTDKSDEYIIHVHTADPAAHFEPNIAAARHAESMAMAVYLPDRMTPMLGRVWVQTKASLSPGKPCLTYSVKTNLAGEILDVKITPGVVNNVFFLTPGVFHQAIFGTPPVRRKRLQVGQDKFQEQSTRPLLQLGDLSTTQKGDLNLFRKLSESRQSAQMQKGSVTNFPGGPQASVSFNGDHAPNKPKTWGARYHGDPSIQISVPELNEKGVDLSALGASKVVASMMLLACEGAARWCHARGIPAVYRISPFNPGKENPLNFYKEHVLPSYDENGFANLEMVMQYLRLVGMTQPSTTPGPHLGIGADMTMQVTSPLRRYGDLLNQWQIEAAIQEEARTGTSLAGNTKDDFLPFSKAQIDALLPRLAERERAIKQGQNAANREWILRYLVRAWKYGEDEIPSPLIFNVQHVDPLAGTVRGILPHYYLGGMMPIPDHMKADEIKVGAAFEVKIQDINVYDRRLTLEHVKGLSLEELES